MAPRRLKWVGKLDMYRKIPGDLLEGTRRGSIFSYVSVMVMLLLFLLETRAYFAKRLVTDLALDRHPDSKMRVNFNITMMDLKCEYASVDVVSVLGTEQNITTHVNKWHVDADGVRQRYQGRNRVQKDIELFDTTVSKTLEELHEGGIDAVSLTPETLDYARREFEYVFVDFYASWCSHCQRLAPTWETLAEIMTVVAESLVEKAHDNPDFTEEEYEHAVKVSLPVMVAKVDCVIYEDLCRQQGILAYPTLRLFVDGERWRGGDYRGDRTIVSMTDWLKAIEDTHKTELEKNGTYNVEKAHEIAEARLKASKDDEGDDMSEEEREWAEQMRRKKQRLHHSWVDSEHPGCQLSGHLLLDRVPGNFHIQARSLFHDIVPHMTNVSHIVHHLSIGEPTGMRMINDGKVPVPDDAKRKLSPMDGNVYVTENLHEAYHHYLKAITTDFAGLKFGRRNLVAYQILQNSQLASYREDVVPEAKFIFDLSPIAVSYRHTSRHWYDYVTSVMAIVGGTFTVVGMVESTINAAVRKRRY